ncbi:hypothetical protein [Janthinobacterium lividum]|uniref:hypothetical protein n=1 Tax=Janthinobacterium lividum TaxID=29581 RepID=UPI00140AC825|nr:hypothetical protein [Janthinobacterium lividum]
MLSPCRFLAHAIATNCWIRGWKRHFTGSIGHAGDSRQAALAPTHRRIQQLLLQVKTERPLLLVHGSPGKGNPSRKTCPQPQPSALLMSGEACYLTRSLFITISLIFIS